MTRACIALLFAELLFFGAVAVARADHREQPATVAGTASAKDGVEPVDDTEELADFEEVEEVTDFEDLDELDDSEVGGAAPARKRRGLGWLIGYFHAAIVHLPIAWLLLLLAIDIAALLLGRRELLPAGYFIALLAAFSFLPAVLSGLLRFDVLNLSGPDAEPALLHRNIELAAAALMICAAALRVHSRKNNNDNLAGYRRHVYLGLVFAATIAVAVGGHLGGQMIFGPIGL